VTAARRPKPLVAAGQSPARSALETFWDIRQRLNQALLAWMGTGRPAPVEVDTEVEGTIATLRQIGRVGGGP
jgi:hypothetical protein